MRLLAFFLAASSLYGDASFDKARAVLTTHCIKCHGADRTLSSFDMGSRESFFSGGRHGAPVVPGKPDASRLFQWVASGKMPQGGAKISQNEIAAIREWIASGADWTAGVKLVGGKRTLWSLRTPVKQPVPEIRGTANPIDVFILQKLQSKKLGFTRAADHRTLLRRLSFDLTGLPPAPGDYKESYDAAIERLIASPHYGERWGRHWLDVVRFGETDGGEHNYERPHAWRYRDYVIESFNQDKPYNQFIREQIAGDVLNSDAPEMVAATGFLVAGPWDQVSAELNKDKVMAATARMDELDDMVTTTFHTFQAMTVNCARCHDHKFDPIPARDYYKLTAVFSGVGFGNRKIATAAKTAEYDQAVKPIREQIDSVRNALARIEEPSRLRLLQAKYIALDRQRENEMLRLPLNPVWNRNRFAPLAGKHWRMVITGNTDKLPRAVNLELYPAGSRVALWQGTAKASYDAPAIVPLGLIEEPVSEIRWAGTVSVYRLEASEDGRDWRTVCSSLDHVGRNEFDLPALPESELVADLSAESRSTRAELLARRTELEAALKAIPELPVVYAAKPRAMDKAFVLERGSVTKPSEEVTAGALGAVTQLGSQFELPVDASDAQRRTALADWITDPKNPLTARVIVNRVWQYHFGQGLVNTPSDFGLNGDRPSHPELLDWLAASFVENGWSLKWLHRLILSSRTYQQSDEFNSRAHEVDANNRLLWRMPLKRMDAETLRDSILFVTGKLDMKMQGGPGFELQKKAARGAFIYEALDNDGPAVWRRAVYRFVVRGGERIMLDSFDCPDPSVATPQRSMSNTAVQALTLLNNEFVLRQAGFLAERLEREAGADRARQIERAYELLHGRAPTAKEMQLGLKFVAAQPLALYCRVLLNSNEFVYVP